MKNVLNGPVGDRGLGALIGALLVGLITGYGGEPGNMALLTFGAMGLGGYIASKIPGEFRTVLWFVGLMVAGWFGLEFVMPSDEVALSAVPAGALVATMRPGGYANRFGRWLLAPLVLLGLVVVSGCGTGPVAQCYAAAGSYEVVQIAIEGAVYSPSVGQGTKEVLKETDRRAVEAAQQCRDAAAASDGDQVAFATGVLEEALRTGRTLLAQVVLDDE